MATDVTAKDFVTIVPVGEGRPLARENNFVTVLTVGAAAGAAEVKVRRSRGERLGLGLKFEGGSAAAEKVRRLLVQSCAEDSPAAKAVTPWGKLIPGDEILAIDEVSVSELTRIDCVRRLKDSDESLSLLVRHFETQDKPENIVKEITETPLNTKADNIVRPTLPPPVPPRKLGKKNSFKEKPTLQTLGEQNIINNDGRLIDKDESLNGVFTKLSRKSSFDSHLLRKNKEGIACLKKGSPEEVRRLERRLSDGKTMPPEAEVYIDLLSTEWERCLVIGDAESDDTGSSISTVVDKLGSMTSSVDNSIPSTPIMQPKTIDIQKVLNCIENIDSNILKDITGNKFMDRQLRDFTKDVSSQEKNTTYMSFDNPDITSVSLCVSDHENVLKTKKMQQNDKNNNNTIIIQDTYASAPETINKSQENNTNLVLEKPKPMPRNGKVERSVSEKRTKSRPAPETPPTAVTGTLLTPTKKDCIETWLQRSEAEMNSKPAEKIEEVVPEVLPRLIDFVPKPQFKESNNEAPLPRPTAPPPPPPEPPVETREDGSGASLDTIGELDESMDVTDNVKPIIKKNETKDQKPAFEQIFWEDRGSKSDVEDKSLSNDETPLPSCPRQPPDGVETPAETVEKVPDLPSRLPPRLPAGWPTSRSRYSYSSRTQDARSEASVKDKIAMFSNGRATSIEHIDKCGTLPARPIPNTRKSSVPYTSNYSDISSLDRRLTKSQDNLDESPRIYKKHIDRPEVLGGLETNSKSALNMTRSSSKSVNDSQPLFYGSTTTLPSNNDLAFSQPIYHMRSVSDDISKTTAPVHKSNLEYLIEQRKKSMSKLKCLVIPEVQAPIVDLPEIKVQLPITKSFPISNQNSLSSKETITNTKPYSINESKWKSSILPNNLPKYSPAFKRKSLQVYTPSISKESTPERKFSEKIDSLSKIMSYAPKPRSALEMSSESRRASYTLPSKTNISNITTISKKDYRDIVNYARDYKNVEIKICTATDIIDSDNDSAMSSTQSSYRSSASSPMHNLDNGESDSSRVSPRSSHYNTFSLGKADNPTKTSIVEKNCEDYLRRNVCRSMSSDTNVSLSSSAGSAATSGSQASCSSLESSVADSDKRKVSKTYNIDTINRRNILASAKCRSGRDAKLKSPVIETKFSHESYDSLPPSPTDKPSERLSTLTSSVSVVTNKGENRRRNKIIAESDSDSDCDVNIRQRKTDYKNSRLKRNSSSTSKSKAIETEEAPKYISEKIIKEIKKAGLDNFNNNKINKTLIKDSFEPITQEIRPVSIVNKPIEPEVLSNKKDVVKSIKNDKITIDQKSKQEKIINNEISTDFIDGSVKESELSSTNIYYLKRGSGTGVGLILAGGVDCEAKHVTVHRVLADSIAAKAGLKRGSKVRSINGLSMTGLTHAQSVTILKQQRSEIVIEIENEIQDNARRIGGGSENAESKVRHVAVREVEDKSSDVVSVILDKAGGGAGLGFGLDGGRDSPMGDRPLTVKKLFAGGAAAQSGRVLVGAELLSAGGQSMAGFTRTQAWAALKALPSGPVTLVLRNPTRI